MRKLVWDRLERFAASDASAHLPAGLAASVWIYTIYCTLGLLEACLTGLFIAGASNFYFTVTWSPVYDWLGLHFENNLSLAVGLLLFGSAVSFAFAWGLRHGKRWAWILSLMDATTVTIGFASKILTSTLDAGIISALLSLTLLFCLMLHDSRHYFRIK